MKKIISIIITTICLISISILSATATSGNCKPFYGTNATKNSYHNYWTRPVYSYLTTCDNGNYMRVQYDLVNSNYESYKEILIEYYDKNFNFIKYKTIKPVLPLFGAFYETDENYYIVSGQDNPDKKASVECYNIAKYDKNWKLIKDIGIKDCDTAYPFEAGSARVAINDKYMVIHTCHKMYNGHQSNRTLYFEIESMSELRATEIAYTSHSFNQFIQTDGENFVTVDHGDAFPRYVSLSVFNNLLLKENDIDLDYVNEYLKSDEYDFDEAEKAYNTLPTYVEMFTYGGGECGDNYTGCNIGGFEVSDTTYIVVGSAVDNSAYGKSSTKNVFVSAINKNEKNPESATAPFEYFENEATITKLTTYKEGKGSANNPHLVKVNNNRFFVLWSNNDKIYYRELNGKGEAVGKTKSFKGYLSDCKPIVSGNKLIWYTTSGAERNLFDLNENAIMFYTIDLSDTSKVKATPIITGKHNYKATKVIEKATFTQKGKQKVVCEACGKKTTQTIPKKTVGRVKNLKAKSTSKTKISLSWSKASNAKKYNVYISTDGRNWKKLITTSKRSYQAKELNSGKVYQFKVRAINGNHKGKESSVLKVKTRLSTPNFELKAMKKKATLNIKSVRGATYYQIVYSTEKSFEGNVKKVYANDAKAIKSTIKKLKKGKKYYFKVRACCKYDGKKIYSAYSKVKSVKIK